MKKQKIFNFLLVLAMFAVVTGATAFFTSCSQASGGGDDTPAQYNQAQTESYAIQTSDGVRYVKNSDWDACTLAVLSAKAASGSRMMARSASPRAAADISAEDLENIVETLNETATDTQYFLSEEDIPVEEGPLCNVYFMNEYNPDDELGESDDGIELDRRENVERAEVKANRWIWDAHARGIGAIMYIDKVPPKPVPLEDPRTPYEKYSVYFINSYGVILYEEHCSETWEDLKDLPNIGYKNVDEYFQSKVEACKQQIVGEGIYGDGKPYWYVAGEIYTPPSPEE